jgi:SpoIIAA-like
LIETVTDLPVGTLGFRASRTITSEEYRQIWSPFTDKDWVRHGASAFGWLAPGELRLFELSEREEARAWLGATSAA